MTAKKLLNKKHVFSLVLLCAVIYFVSYVTRINYSAVLVEIMKSENYPKTVASVPLTGLFIVYGIGQLISGFLGDRFSSEKIIFTGLLLTGSMNLLLPFAPSPLFMTIIWSINGFAQALMWPPLVKILARYMTKDAYSTNIVYIILGSSIGTVFVYTVSPLVISLSGNWKYVFFGASSIAFIAAIIWIMSIFRFEKLTQEIEIDIPPVKNLNPKGSIPFTKMAILLLGIVMFTNIFQGLLRDGIATWMPTYMAESFGFSSSSAIFTGVALPIATITISFFTATIYRKILKNEAKCTTLFFAICTACCVVLCLSQNSSAVLSTVMLMAANAATHAINFMYTAIVVAKFERFNKTSFVTGAINSSVYIGSAVSTYGIAAINENFGWTGTLITWLGCAIIGLVVSIFSIKPFKKEL